MEGKKIKNKALALVMAISMVFQTVAPAVVYAQEDDSISETIMSETLSEDKKFSGNLGLRFEDIEGYFFEDIVYENMTLEELVKFIKDKGKENKTPIITRVEYRKDNEHKTRYGLALDEELLESGVRISVFYAKPYLNYVNSELYNPDKESFYDVDFDFSRFGYNIKTVYDDTLPLGTRVTDQEGKRYINKFTADVIYGDKDYSNIKNHEQQDEQDEIIRIGTGEAVPENQEGFNIVLNDDLTANVSASAVQDENKRPSKIVVKSNPQYLNSLTVNSNDLPSSVDDYDIDWSLNQVTLNLKEDNNDRSFSFSFDYKESSDGIYNGLKIPFVIEMYSKDGSLLSRSNTVYKEVIFDKPSHQTSIRKLKSWSDANTHDMITNSPRQESSFVEAGIADENNKYLINTFPVEVIVSKLAHTKVEVNEDDNTVSGTGSYYTFGKIVNTDKRKFDSVEKRVYIPTYTAYNTQTGQTEERKAEFNSDISGDWKLSDDGSYVYIVEKENNTFNNLFSNNNINYMEDKNYNLQATNFPHFTFDDALLNKNIDVKSEVIRKFKTDGGNDDDVRNSKDTVSFIITADEKRGGHILKDIRNPHYDNPNDDNGTAYFYDYYSETYNKERNGEFKWTMSVHNKKNSGTDIENIFSAIFNDDNLDERMKFVGIDYNDKRGHVSYKLFDVNDEVVDEGELKNGVRFDIPDDIQEDVKRIEVFADGIDIKKGDNGFVVNIYTRLKNPQEDFGDNRNFINESHFELVTGCEINDTSKLENKDPEINNNEDKGNISKGFLIPVRDDNGKITHYVDKDGNRVNKECVINSNTGNDSDNKDKVNKDDAEKKREDVDSIEFKDPYEIKVGELTDSYKNLIDMKYKNKKDSRPAFPHIDKEIAYFENKPVVYDKYQQDVAGKGGYSSMFNEERVVFEGEGRKDYISFLNTDTGEEYKLNNKNNNVMTRYYTLDENPVFKIRWYNENGAEINRIYPIKNAEFKKYLDTLREQTKKAGLPMDSTKVRFKLQLLDYSRPITEDTLSIGSSLRVAVTPEYDVPVKPDMDKSYVIIDVRNKITGETHRVEYDKNEDAFLENLPVVNDGTIKDNYDITLIGLRSKDTGDIYPYITNYRQDYQSLAGTSSKIDELNRIDGSLLDLRFTFDNGVPVVKTTRKSFIPEKTLNDFKNGDMIVSLYDPTTDTTVASQNFGKLNMDSTYFAKPEGCYYSPNNCIGYNQSFSFDFNDDFKELPAKPYVLRVQQKTDDGYLFPNAAEFPLDINITGSPIQRISVDRIYHSLHNFYWDVSYRDYNEYPELQYDDIRFKFNDEEDYYDVSLGGNVKYFDYEYPDKNKKNTFTILGGDNRLKFSKVVNEEEVLSDNMSYVLKGLIDKTLSEKGLIRRPEWKYDFTFTYKEDGIYAQLDKIKAQHEQDSEDSLFEFIKKIFTGRDKDNVVMRDVKKQTNLSLGKMRDVYIDEEYNEENYHSFISDMKYDMPEFLNGKNLVYTVLLPENVTYLSHEIKPYFVFSNSRDAELGNIQSKVIENYNKTGRTAIVVTSDEFNKIKSVSDNDFTLLLVDYIPNTKTLGDTLITDVYMTFDDIEEYDVIDKDVDIVDFEGKTSLHVSGSSQVKRKPGIYGTNLVKEENSDNWEKVIESKYDETKTYQYKIAEENLSKIPVSDFELINVFPYEGDKYLVDNNNSRGSNITPYISDVRLNSYKFDYEFLQISKEEMNNYNNNDSYNELSSRDDWSYEIPSYDKDKVVLMKLYSEDGEVVDAGESVEAVVDIQIPALNSLITSGLLLTNTFVRKDSSTGDEWVESDKSELNIKFDINGRFKKVDSRNNENLTGVEFELRNGDEVIDTLTSDNNGNVFFTFDNEDYNDLTIVETKPLEGYKTLDNVIKLSDYDIKNMRLDIGTVENDPDITLFNVKVNKSVDMGDEKNINDNLDFRLTYDNGVGVAGKTVYLKDKNGDILEELITDSNGYVISENKYSSVKGYYFEVNGGERYDVNFNGYGVVSDLGNIDELRNLFDKDISYRNELIGDMSFEEFVNQSLTDDNVMKYYYFMKPFEFQYYYDGKLVDIFEINMRDDYIIKDIEDVSKVEIKEINNNVFTPSYSDITEVDGLYNIDIVNKLNNEERNMTEGVVKFIPNTGITSFK